MIKSQVRSGRHATGLRCAIRGICRALNAPPMRHLRPFDDDACVEDFEIVLAFTPVQADELLGKFEELGRNRAEVVALTG